MNIQGVIKNIGASEFLGANEFEKRDLILKTEEQYPQTIIIQFTQGRCALLDAVQVGQKVNVHFNLRGREWISPQGELKYFNTLEGWKVELIQVSNVVNQQNNYQRPVQQPTANSYHPVAQRQPQQMQMFDNYGQAPTQFEPIQANNENFDDLPF